MVQINDGSDVFLVEVREGESVVWVKVEVFREVSFGARGRGERGNIAAQEFEGILAAMVWLRGRVRIKEEVGGRGVA